MDRRYYSKRHFQMLADNSRQSDDGNGARRIFERETRKAIHAALVAERGQPTAENALEWVTELETRIAKAGV